MRFSAAVFGLIGLALSFLAPRSLSADVVESTGTITRVPGFPGEELEYSARAVKTGDDSAHFWLDLTNPGAVDIDVVLCAMVSINGQGTVPADSFVVEKNDTDQWECQEAGEASIRPDHHFGCRQVTIPAGRKLNAIDEPIEFSTDFDEEDLGVIYFDILKDCPLLNCGQVVGMNNWLKPRSPAGRSDWVNVWAGHSPFEDLAAADGTSFRQWPSGNWLTMGNSDREFPAVMRGALTNAPAGSEVQFVFNGEPAEILDVGRAEDGDPCDGENIEFEMPFTIPADRNALDGVRIAVPDGPCGRVKEGTVARLSSEVFATAETPFYDEGEFMHAIDLVFVRDTAPPAVREANITSENGAFRAAAAATDLTTRAVGASLRFLDAEGEQMEIPLQFGDPPTQGELTFFEGELAVGAGAPEQAVLNIYDDVGNRRSLEDLLQEPVNAAAVSAASFEPAGLPPDSIASIFGEFPGIEQQAAGEVPLPTALGGGRVEVVDALGVSRPAALFFASNRQINFVIPGEAAPGEARVRVFAQDQQTASARVRISAVAPGLFFVPGESQAAAATFTRDNGDGSVDSGLVFDPETGEPSAVDLGGPEAEVFLSLFGTGIRGREQTAALMASVGGRNVPVTFAGEQGQFVGLDQANIGPLPRELAGQGDVSVTISVGTQRSNAVTVRIQ